MLTPRQPLDRYLDNMLAEAIQIIVVSDLYDCISLMLSLKYPL